MLSSKLMFKETGVFQYFEIEYQSGFLFSKNNKNPRKTIILHG